jgi:hypothetical protein
MNPREQRTADAIAGDAVAYVRARIAAKPEGASTRYLFGGRKVRKWTDADLELAVRELQSSGEIAITNGVWWLRGKAVRRG